MLKNEFQIKFRFDYLIYLLLSIGYLIFFIITAFIIESGEIMQPTDIADIFILLVGGAFYLGLAVFSLGSTILLIMKIEFKRGKKDA